MYYVYILQSKSHKDQMYFGFTENLKQRVQHHNSGSGGFHSAKFKPWKLIYSSIFKDKKKALDFEKYLKTASGKAFARKRFI